MARSTVCLLSAAAVGLPGWLGWLLTAKIIAETPEWVPIVWVATVLGLTALGLYFWAHDQR